VHPLLSEDLKAENNEILYKRAKSQKKDITIVDETVKVPILNRLSTIK